MVGVELDSMTARISAALYPSAQVRNEGFETTRVPEGTQPHDITQAKHDERMGKFEATWRDREGFEGVPYPGPVPDSVREGWEERAWTPTAPSKRYAHLDGGIRDDPGFATVAMLEHFDEETQTARKATIFATDVLTARVPRTSAANAEEAVAISMDETGTLDVDRIAELLGLDPAAARAALVGSVFADPTDSTRLVTAARYLSGNVRTKLAAAQAAVEHDPAYGANVAALAGVLPRTIEASEIELRPGAPWIDPTDYEAFVREVLQAPSVAVDFAAGTWTVEVSGWERGSPVMTEVYGTGSYDAAKLLEAVCNSRPIQVLRPKQEVAERGGDLVDMEETFAAQAQARKLTEKFREWVWTDEDRRDRLVTEYNTRFNSLRPARYDGSALALPGQSGRTPHPHQRDAVARIIAEPTVLLDHVVGAGKAGVMVMGAMELRRLGLARQPWIVVPNHLVEQVGREAKQWYPAANILIGSNTTNLSAANASPRRPRPVTGSWCSSPSRCSRASRCPRSAKPRTWKPPPPPCAPPPIPVLAPRSSGCSRRSKTKRHASASSPRRAARTPG